MTTSAYEGWALVELVGRKPRAGRVMEIDYAGTKMLRVDIPEEPDDIIEIYGGAAICCVHPIDETTAREIAKSCKDEWPLTPFLIRKSADAVRWTTELIIR